MKTYYDLFCAVIVMINRGLVVPHKGKVITRGKEREFLHLRIPEESELFEIIDGAMDMAGSSDAEEMAAFVDRVKDELGQYEIEGLP